MTGKGTDPNDPRDGFKKVPVPLHKGTGTFFETVFKGKGFCPRCILRGAQIHVSFDDAPHLLAQNGADAASLANWGALPQADPLLPSW